mmetsp:Transcript_25235/g.42042  ORF Transcript_25235/g.42042 Transcript_25235/m.42042 type:complete len:217 (+) Transcript_25235:4022-4672(+)
MTSRSQFRHSSIVWEGFSCSPWACSSHFRCKPADQQPKHMLSWELGGSKPLCSTCRNVKSLVSLIVSPFSSTPCRFSADIAETFDCIHMPSEDSSTLPRFDFLLCKLKLDTSGVRVMSSLFALYCFSSASTFKLLFTDFFLLFATTSSSASYHRSSASTVETESNRVSNSASNTTVRNCGLKDPSGAINPVDLSSLSMPRSAFTSLFASAFRSSSS